MSKKIDVLSLKGEKVKDIKLEDHTIDTVVLYLDQYQEIIQRK